jgi:two-component system CheB/CheR fusion protein
MPLRDDPAKGKFHPVSGPAADLGEELLADEIDDIVPSRGTQTLPVVALGGSAGSIQALQEFFKLMPANSGMAFVVVLHLSPEHESSLDELLGRITKMPVSVAKQGQTIEANSIYVIPPGKHISSIDGRFSLFDIEPERGRRVAVDLFLRSLADTHGPHALAIILSGADSDGAIGIKRIKERGGLTIAQEPEEAEHSGMPRAAIATGMVDWVLRVAEMPERLQQYAARERTLQVPPEEGPQPARATSPTKDENELALREVLTYLRTRTGHDFSYYKRATIIRRIARRMQINNVDTVGAYLDYLRVHAGEAGALLQDLLISVTNFFRDRDCFEALEPHIPDLLRTKHQNEHIRVWVPACATGEEAYSLAILFFEHARRLDLPMPTLQIFGCDLDESAIQIARAGVYPDTIAADVSPQRLQRFFVKEHRGYRVRREVREAVLFAVHDLLRDPPFSRMDLISCRNLLIYLNRDAQQRVFDIFHFALRQDGILFLGASESIEDSHTAFGVLDKKHRIFTHKTAPRSTLPAATGRSPLHEVIQHSVPSGLRPVLPGAAFTNASGAVEFTQREAGFDPRPLPGELHMKLLERFAPPSILVDREHEIVHLSPTAGKFLQVAGGEPSRNLVHLIHPMLRGELRAALFRAVEGPTPVQCFRVPVDLGGARELVDIHVSSAAEVAPGYLLVVFDAQPLSAGESAEAIRAEPEPVVRHLERELEAMKSQLRDTVEQYEAGTEELKASNEELQAMNEELRSATEELETSREELQSVNEELASVNQELKGKVDQLAHANADLQNFLASTAIATVFVDRELRVMRYTPPAVEIFHFIPGDVGRPLKDLRDRLDYPELSADAEQVLENLTPIEREVSDQAGSWYLARMRVYRTEEDRIGGVVLTLVDISRRRLAEENLLKSEESFRLLIESARESAIFGIDLERQITSWNTGAERLLGYREEEVLHHSGDVIFTPEDRAAGGPQDEASRALRDGRAEDERWHMRKDGTRFWGSGFLMTMNDSAGKPIGFVKILHDRTKAKKAEDALAQSRERLERALAEAQHAREEAEAAGKAKDQFFATLSHELRTPLVPVMITAESLLRRKDLPQRVTEGLQMICRNVELQRHFIDDLLDLTRISRGKFELNREPLDLHDAVRGAVQVCEPEIAAKQQKLTVELTATERTLLGDFPRVQQIFWNLLKNASKFTPDHGEIRIATRNENRAILVTVSDSGMGIKPDSLTDIFEAFRQGDASIAQKYGGLGLGLAISRATAEALGGSISASSDGPGRGATFTVKLPLIGNEGHK